LVWNVEGVGEVVEERKWRGIDVVTRKMRESLCIGTLTLPHTLFHHKIDRLPFSSFPLISRPYIPYQSITNPSVSFLKNLKTVFLNMTLCKIAQYIHFTR